MTKKVEKTKKGNQLHQLLAVESELKNTAASILAETRAVFKSKQGHFDGEIRDYRKIKEDSDDMSPEEKQVVTTVKNKIDYTKKSVIDSIDAMISKEQTNSSGNTIVDLSVNDTDFGALSATALLQLEGQLKVIRLMYQAIPTLDPVKKWKYNADKAFYETDEEKTYRTSKEPEVVVLHGPTKEHPAQTQLINKDVQVGVWEKRYQSGRITPLNKSRLLGRIDELLKAVKKARSLANNAEVSEVKIGKKVFDYINKGILK